MFPHRFGSNASTLIRAVHKVDMLIKLKALKIYHPVSGPEETFSLCPDAENLKQHCSVSCWLSVLCAQMNQTRCYMK